MFEVSVRIKGLGPGSSHRLVSTYGAPVRAEKVTVVTASFLLPVTSTTVG